MTSPEIINSLEQAEEGSSELDAQVICAIRSDLTYCDGQVVDDDGYIFDIHFKPKPLTTSLDDAVALVEETFPSHDWSLSADGENRCYWATIGDDNWDEAMSDYVGRGNTPALAMMVCLLKAKSGDKSDALPFASQQLNKGNGG